MRAFIAVEISEGARTEVARLQETLITAGADVKWVEPRNLHLTLKFLGEVPEEKIPALTESLGRTAAETPPFSFSLQGVGAFPRMEHPRVIWVGVQEGKEQLVQLAEKVGGERPFSPHLTIGRVRSGARLAPLPFKAGEPILADRLVLFQSVLSPDGSIYTPLAILPFSTGR